jgi:molybdate transport system ATP-binding protein
MAKSADPAVLFRADRVTATRPAGEAVFDGLSWEMRDGETWAVVGPVGSGKTALGELLAGRLRVTAGTVEWPLVDRLRAAGRVVNWPSDVVGRVGFKEESRIFSYSRHYYQQRFNFIEPADDLTLEEFLRADGPLSDDRLRAVTGRLGIAELLPLSFIKLSNGQTRRARIARALLAHPEVLVLDEPFVGLDADGRREANDLLGRVVDDGTRVVLITPPERIPEWVTHVLELVDRRVAFQGTRGQFQRADSAEATPASAKSSAVAGEPVIKLRDVNVIHGGKPILRGINWTVREGERWAIVGPNGSGKTTLLSLICGDHPQAYSNDVTVFGRRRGGGESIWDVKKRIGLVSPELHMYFTEPLTADRAAATGFFDQLVARPTTPGQDATVRELFDYFGVTELAGRRFAQLSTGQQRIVLLIRALVKDPPLLILDEPFQVLDEPTAAKARRWIDDRLAPDRTVLFVTHNEPELPRTVTRRLRLREGVLVEER